MLIRLVVYLILGVWVWLPILCLAQAQTDNASKIPPNTIVIKDHQFDPLQLTVPAGQKIKLTVENHDPTVEEFESFDLNREKIVSGNKKIIVFIGPLKQGAYKYFGDFHQKTAQGVIVAQ